MEPAITINITTGKVGNFTEIEELISWYCQLPLKEKMMTFVLGISDEVLDYPAMMEFIFDYDRKHRKASANPHIRNKKTMIDYLNEKDGK